VSYAAANAPVVANLLSPKKNTGFAAGDSYNSIENLRGSAYADTLIGNALDNIIEGGPGADSMNGGAGIDTASYANAGAGVHADLQYPQNNTGDARGDTYKGSRTCSAPRITISLVATRRPMR
jgi:Ca2+-binding RTX toxin-like protein